jgi:trehalose 6-phosphate synthase
VANATLWFVHHLLFDTAVQPCFGPEFRRDWQSYVAYNQAFARALGPAATLAPVTARVLVQDYHLALVPRMLRDKVPGIRIAHFSHTPWAPVDYYRILPEDIGRAILDGMLGADHAGFLCQRWADAFLDCCEALLGAQVDRAAQHVIHRGHVTGVGVHPLGVDARALRERARAVDVEAHVAALTRAAAGRKLIVRIDRTDLSKNILRGLAAYRELLTSRPEWRGQVVHVAFAYPSRSSVPGYREYTDEVLRMAAGITEEFATADWNPLILEVKDDYPRSLAAGRVADVLVVNPIRDGMNLVAEEGPVLSDHGCALVLSREAGAASLLGSDALLVNPYDVSATAAAMHQALLMPEDERRRRCAALAAAAAANAPSHWLTAQLDALG